MSLESIVVRLARKDPKVRRLLIASLRESRFTKGVPVPLSELPEEFQEMNENPPESVLRVREEMMGKSASYDVLNSGDKMTKLDRFILRVANQDPYVRNALKEELARYERGEDVPLEDLPEELQENVEDPPPSVAELTRKMERMARRKQAKINERSRLGRR